MNNTLRKKLQIIGDNIQDYFLYRFETLEYTGEEFVERVWRDNWHPFSSTDIILNSDFITKLKKDYAKLCYQVLAEMINDTMAGENWEGGDDDFDDESITPFKDLGHDEYEYDQDAW